MANIGQVKQVIGPVVDVSFAEESSLPEIYNALEINRAKAMFWSSKYSSTWVRIASAPLRWTLRRVWFAAWKWSTPNAQ